MNPQGVVFSPIQSSRLFEGVLDQLRDAIFAGQFRPGDQLPTERDLAAAFGVSRASVREALRILELSDMVHIRQGRNGGIFVAEAPAQPVRLALHTLLRHQRFDIKDLFATKILLEERIVQEAARRISKEQLVQLRLNVEQCEAYLRDGQPPYHKGHAFHIMITRVLDNPLLDDIVCGLADIVSIVRETCPLDSKYERTIVLEHREILEALQARKPRAAGDAMVRHLKTIETFFLRSQPPQLRTSRAAADTASGIS